LTLSYTQASYSTAALTTGTSAVPLNVHWGKSGFISRCS